MIMKPIRVLSPQLGILAEIDDYESLIFTRRFHKVGEFELHINQYKKNVDKLQKGSFIFLSNNKVGVIKHREIGFDESGKKNEAWVIKGYTLQGLTKQRITVPPAGLESDDVNADTETVIKTYVDHHIVNPIDVNRKIDLVALAANQTRGQTLDWKSRYMNLADEIESISLASGIGWDIYLDFGLMKAVFEVYEGRNLTVDQSVNPPVIFSPEFDSLKNQRFFDSDINHKNYAYTGGVGEGTARIIAMVGTAAGIERQETFIDARDIADANLLAERGIQKLEEFAIDLVLEGEILTNSPFKYEVDYDLGDIVTLQNKNWGVTTNARITEIKEIYEPGGFRLEAIFGKSVPTLISKFKQEIGQLDAEVRR